MTTPNASGPPVVAVVSSPSTNGRVDARRRWYALCFKLDRCPRGISMGSIKSTKRQPNDPYPCLRSNHINTDAQSLA